jgi:hypothetical protein
MNPIILIVVVCVICAALVALVYVAYMQVNKPVKKEAPLLSDAQVSALMAKYTSATGTPVAYSNILNYSIGHVGHVLSPGIPPNSLNITQCNQVCNGTPECKGFQFNSVTNKCELLSNVANTFFSSDQNWNIFVPGDPPIKAVGPTMAAQGYSADPSKKKGPIVGVSTIDACIPYCFSNSQTCVGMTISSGGCSLFADTSTIIPDNGSNSWALTPVTHGQGLTI